MEKIASGRRIVVAKGILRDAARRFVGDDRLMRLRFLDGSICGVGEVMFGHINKLQPAVAKWNIMAVFHLMIHLTHSDICGIRRTPIPIHNKSIEMHHMA